VTVQWRHIVIDRQRHLSERKRSWCRPKENSHYLHVHPQSVSTSICRCVTQCCYLANKARISCVLFCHLQIISWWTPLSAKWTSRHSFRNSRVISFSSPNSISRELVQLKYTYAITRHYLCV
jgi:hypothetical protein